MAFPEAIPISFLPGDSENEAMAIIELGWKDFSEGRKSK